MALDTKHPFYTERAEQWQKLADCYAGEDAIKAAGETYLPSTSGMKLDGLKPGQNGYHAYWAYKMRAVFPSFVTRGVQAMVGAMHNKPPQVELPAALEPLRARATLNGESLNLLLRRINEAQLTTGRIGLLGDLPISEAEVPLPYLCTYSADSILNWDEGEWQPDLLQTLNLVVLNESGYMRTKEFEWEMVERYRALVLGTVEGYETSAIYRSGLFVKTTTFSEEALQIPLLRGEPLRQIPFVFINASDLLPTPQAPPLLELANLCLAIYRGEADYRQSQFMQGQSTVVTIGDREPPEVRLGAGGHIHIANENGDAKFIGVSGHGLPEQRQSLENDRRQAKEMAGQMLDTASRQKESGEALRTRVAAQTVTLNQIAQTGAEGLQVALRILAEWAGADPAQVKVQPNLEFAEQALTPGEFLQLVDAKGKGLPLSDESIHAELTKAKMTMKDFATEMAQVVMERQKMEAARAAMNGNNLN